LVRVEEVPFAKKPLPRREGHSHPLVLEPHGGSGLAGSDLAEARVTAWLRVQIQEIAPVTRLGDEGEPAAHQLAGLLRAGLVSLGEWEQAGRADIECARFAGQCPEVDLY